MHPWDWVGLLPQEQRRHAHRRRTRQRWWARLREPRSWLVGLLGLELGLAALLGAGTGAMVGALVVLQLLLAPWLGWLVWWLVWTEFHN